MTLTHITMKHSHLHISHNNNNLHYNEPQKTYALISHCGIFVACALSYEHLLVHDIHCLSIDYALDGFHRFLGR